MIHPSTLPPRYRGGKNSCAMGLLLLLTACVGVPQTYLTRLDLNSSGHITETHSQTTEQATPINAVFQQSKRWVEAATQTQLDHVSLKLVSNQEIQKYVTSETSRLVNNEFNQKAFAHKFLTKIIDDQSASYAALYVGDTQQILVNSSLLRIYIDSLPPDPTVINQALMALLVHELVHAADDQRYEIHKNRVLRFKASFTQSAAFEGHAQMVTRQICTEKNCLEGLKALDNFMFDTTQLADPVAQSVQAVSRNVLEYSYIEGERFLTALQNRPDGKALIDSVLRNPPNDPVQILVPETYPDLDREIRNGRLINAISGTGHSWSEHPWVTVETSPIKGINVRDNPAKRVAAVEGFTELITAMTGAQIYNQLANDIVPIELTLIETNSPDTAKLFANSFIQRSNEADAALVTLWVKESLPVDSDLSDPIPYNAYLLGIPTKQQVRTLVGIAGNYVIQVSATLNMKPAGVQSYARAIMQKLLTDV